VRNGWVAAGLLLVVVASSSVASAALPPGGTFIDDDGNPFEGSIEAIAAEGITKGCNPPVNNKFCPDDNVTRGEMALFLVRAMGYTDNGGGNLFIDDDGTFYEDAADKLGTAKVTLGCNPPANDKFCGNNNVTRGQMAAFLVRAMGYTDNGGGNLFIDDDGHFFENDIDKLATAGVTKGCGPALYCPNNFVTRGQMAAFLTRALGLTPIVPPPSTTTTTTTTKPTTTTTAAVTTTMPPPSTTTTTTGPTTYVVAMGEYFFAPMNIVISVGDKIRWRNDGIEPHTSTSGIQPIASGTWDSPLLWPGESYTRTFDSVGSFSYFCILHSGQTGNVTVNP